MKRARTVLSLALCCLFCDMAAAHEVRPAYLELRQTGAESHDVLWKVPGRGEDMRLGLNVQFPANCSPLSAPSVSLVNSSFIERWSITCAGGLSGGEITITGLSMTMTDVLVRLERLEGSTQIARLTAGNPTFRVEASPDRWQVVRAYSVLGVEHILSGADHLLFVLGLIIITRGGWRLVKTVTAFTISHSITLTAATLGFVHVPQRPVEAVIALSILFVAAEILHGRQGREGITARAPWVVALTFGLLHGLGFAGGLSEAGLPQGHIPTALLFFSIGVETGHFLFIGMVVSAVALARRAKLTAPAWMQLVPPYAIGAVASFWLIERSLAILI